MDLKKSYFFFSFRKYFPSLNMPFTLYSLMFSMKIQILNLWIVWYSHNHFICSSLPYTHIQAKMTLVCDLARVEGWKNSRDQSKVTSSGSAGCGWHSQHGFWLRECMNSPQLESSGKVESNVPCSVSPSVSCQTALMEVVPFGCSWSFEPHNAGWIL